MAAARSAPSIIQVPCPISGTARVVEPKGRVCMRCSLSLSALAPQQVRRDEAGRRDSGCVDEEARAHGEAGEE